MQTPSRLSRTQIIVVSIVILALASCTTPPPETSSSTNDERDGSDAGTANGDDNNADEPDASGNNEEDTFDEGACLAACPQGCPPPPSQPCANDGNLYCTECEILCMGLELADDPSLCAPTGMGDLTLGRACDETEACVPGLVCRDVLIGDTCQPNGTSCSALCTSDEDCAPFVEEGQRAGCFEDCDGSMVCSLIASVDLPPGAVCQDTSQCQNGLECLTLTSGGPGNCQPLDDTCTIECTDNADCEAFAPNFRCFSQCDGSMVCGLIGG